MGDHVHIETKGNKIVSVRYTDEDGNSVNIGNVKSVQTYRVTSSNGSADKVALTLAPDVVEWAVEFGEDG